MKIKKGNPHGFVLAMLFLFISICSQACYANLEKYLFFDTNGNCNLIIDKASVENNRKIIQEIIGVLVSKKPFPIDKLIIFGFRSCYNILQPIWDIFVRNPMITNLIIDGNNINNDINETNAIENNLNIFMILLKKKSLTIQLNQLKTKLLENQKLNTGEKSIIDDDIPSIDPSDKENYNLRMREFELKDQITDLDIDILQLTLDPKNQQQQPLQNHLEDSTTPLPNVSNSPLILSPIPQSATESSLSLSSTSSATTTYPLFNNTIKSSDSNLIPQPTESQEIN